MEWLNYHHLLYFWTVAREGGLAKASAVLHLAHPTLSGQIRKLEESLGEKLFQKSGRRLVLTETGQMVYRYADEIFALGREMMDAVRDRPTGRPIRLQVGAADALPKTVVRRLLRPVLTGPEPVYLVCREDKPERLFAQLAAHDLDVVLADAPVPPSAAVRAYNHPLGESGVTLVAAPVLAARLRPAWPRSLDGAPFLMPTEESACRRALEAWLAREGLRPSVVAEFEDGALLKSFGGDGVGVFPVADVILDEVCAAQGCEPLGPVPGVVERYFAVTVERRVKHPATTLLLEAARRDLFR